MKINTWTIIFSLFIFKSSFYCFASDAKENFPLFGEVYFESTRLTEAKTFAGFTQVRTGRAWESGQLETYITARMGADSRTNSENSLSVYNDNFVFTGVGVDYLGILPGFRATSQVGASFDLSSKIHSGGFDFRIGSQSYHEINWIGRKLVSEVYSELLYFRRYLNLLGNIQFRTVYNLVTASIGNTRLEFAPLVNIVGAVDSQGLDYNRFGELRMGARITFRGPITVALSPYYVLGARWARPTNTPQYEDFRILLTGFISI